MIEEAVRLLVFPGFLSAIFIGFVYEGIIRKIAARMHNRIGPPIWQPFFDWVKLMSKEDINTKYSSFLSVLSPVIALSSALTVAAFIPIAGSAVISFTGDLLLVIYLIALSTLMIALAGFASGNMFGSVGGIREIIQMFAYELALIISLLTVGFMTSFSIQPFSALAFPFALVAFIVCLQGELGLPPFHIPDSEQEVVSGPFTEYSGRKLAMFSLARAARLWILVSFGAVFFFGATTLAWFFIYSLLILFIVIVIRTIFARLKINQMFRFYWFVLAPIALIDLVRVLLGWF
jgi:NADH-quinone oxidoreductase subunit H